MVRLSVAARTSAFGRPGHVDRVQVTTPWGIRVACHPAVAATFLDACREADRVCGWKPRRIDGYANRAVRGSASPSLHSWALAWDFFATPPNVPPPGGVWTPHDGMPADFARCFTRRGFTWGAIWKRKDVPHIEWAGPPPGRYTAARPTAGLAAPDEEDDVALTPAEKQALALIPELNGRLVKLEHTVAEFHQASTRHRVELRDTLAALIRDRHDNLVAHTRTMRDTLAALARRLMGVDPKARNDHEPYWKAR